MVDEYRNKEKPDEGTEYRIDNEGKKVATWPTDFDFSAEIQKAVERVLQNTPTILSPKIMGNYLQVDPNGDLVIGNYAGGQGIKWNQSTGLLDIQGGIVVDSLDIPDLVTANSFHVNTAGDVWWGATIIGSAVAKVLKTGVATFTNVIISGLGAGSVLDGQYVTDNTITALKINVANLAAIKADLGSITAGNITLDTSGYVRGGQTAYNTGTGFFLGYSGAAYKFSIGNPAGYFMTWDGSDIIINSKSLNYNNGLTTRGSATASGNQTIAHGLGKIPKIIKISANCDDTLSANHNQKSWGVYNGSTNNCIYFVSDSGGFEASGKSTSQCIHIEAYRSGVWSQVATVTVDATNITLAWTFTAAGSNPNGNINIMWEAF